MAVSKKANPVVIAYQIARNQVWFEKYGIFFCEKECEQLDNCCSTQCEKCSQHYTELLK